MGAIGVKGYCCDRCKKLIDEDDIEAIEVKQVFMRQLFHRKDDSYRPVTRNDFDENQNQHYCGNCKGDFYDWFE